MLRSFLILASVLAQLKFSLSTVNDSVIVNWVKCTGKNGYNSQLSDVQKIEYSTNYVYITSTSIPGTYTVGGGGWADDPYTPVAQPTFRVKIPRNPTVATTNTAFTLGTVGLLLNGVSLYNANDGNSYNNEGVWYRNAYFFEGYSFDNCTGHASAGSGTIVDGLYHHHARPVCFSKTESSSSHSPLLGYALDGFPIYGPYGYTTATDTSSAIKKLTSCYSAATYAGGTRNVKGDGTSVTKSGPSTTATYQLNSKNASSTVALSSGAYLYDYVFSASGCDLNTFNGRFQKTPEYPNGIFCYIMTDTYPYIFGPGNFYGNVASTSTYVNVSETTTVYFQYSSGSVSLNKFSSLMSLIGSAGIFYVTFLFN